MPVSVEILRDDLRDLREMVNKSELETAVEGLPIQNLSVPQLIDGRFFLELEYQRIVPGRVELMQQIQTEVEIIVEPVDNTRWRVICFPQSNQDVKYVESIFNKLGNTNYEAFSITLDFFSQRQRIQFFDDLLDHYSSDDEWQFREVVGITVRQQKSKGNLVEPDQDVVTVDDEENDGSNPEPTQDDLMSITQAVLDGQNLRINSFVQRCVARGFHFPAMTLLLDNKTKPERIRVAVRFKLSPHVFEIVLTETSLLGSMGERSISLSIDRQREILKDFWETSHFLWQRIYKDLPLVNARLQRPLVDALSQSALPFTPDSAPPS